MNPLSLSRASVLGLVAAPKRAARDIIDLGRAVHGMLVELGRALERAKDDAAGEFTAAGRRLADDIDQAVREEQEMRRAA